MTIDDPSRMPVLKKLPATSAAALCRDFDLTPDARPLLADELPAAEFLRRLTDAGLLLDAIAFLARALPKREAVWWACMCARTTAPEAASADHPDSRALAAAEAWVYKPTEENRRDTDVAAQAARFESPESWAAIAAFWSGGSIAPPDGPLVSPGDDLTPRAVAGAVMLAAVRRQPERAEEHYRIFLGKGLDIAAGGTGRADTPIA